MDELTVVTLSPAHEDDRGAIVDLLDGEEVRHVGLITCQPDAVRGNHYHERQKQWLYVLDGSIDLYLEDLRECDPEVRRVEMRAGALIYVPPRVAHAVVAREPSRLLDFNDLERGEDGAGYERDTVRLDDSLVDRDASSE